MKVFWLLGLLALCFSVFANGINNNASRPTFVNIGALFTFESTIGRVAKIALQTAVNDVNSNSSILHGTKLNLIMRNSNCSAFVGMMQAMQFMQSNIVALIGPQSSVAAHSVSYVASELQVPLVSFSATDPYISQREFPFFVRTTQSDLYQMTAIAEIVDYYGWTQVIAVFIDDEYGRNGVSALDDALAERRCKISEKVGIKPDSNISRSEIMDHLVKFMLLESRVIILHVNPDTGFMIFKVAKYLGMMGTGYVWLSTDWLSSVLDSSSPLPPEAMETLQGVIVLRQHTPNSDRKRALISRWRSLTNGSFGLNSYGFYAYDSVWLVAHALDAFLDRGGAISFSNDPNLRFLDHSDLHLETMSVFDGGKLLLQNILQRNLVGVSGPLKFDSDRSLIHPAYDIINVIGTGYRQVGYWSNYSGLSTMSPEMLYQRPPNHSSASQHLYVVFWPGGTTEVPRGWVLPSNGKQLEVGVPIRVSFQEFVSQVRESNDMFKGFCIDVFTAAVKLLPYALPYRFVGYGDGHKNPNYSKLVDMVAEGNLDAAIGDIAIVTSRTKVVDFTQPYAASGLVVVASFKSSNTGAWAFLRPFTPLTWGIIVVFFIIIGVVVWILEHRINDEFRGSPQMQLITILWFSFSTLTFSHRQNTISSLARLLLIIWLFVVLILTSSYTASLTSILTVKQLSSPIKGVDSLRAGNGKIGYQVGSYAEQYLNKELNISESRLVALNSSEEYAEALQQGRIEAVVDERPYIELFLSSQCDFRVVGQEFTRSGWGFAFPRDSPLATDMSTAILKLSENGELQRIHDKWLTKSACNVDTAEIESSQLHLKSFAGLFLLSGLAFSIALCIHFVYICRRFHQASVTEIVSSGEGSSRLKRLRTLLSVIDEKKNPLEDKRKKRKTEGSSSDNEDEDHQRNVRRKPTNNEDEDHQRNVKRNPTDVSTCGSINISG